MLLRKWSEVGKEMRIVKEISDTAVGPGIVKRQSLLALTLRFRKKVVE